MSRIFAVGLICLFLPACDGWQIANAILSVPDVIRAGRALAADNAPTSKLVCDVPPGVDHADPTLYCHSETVNP